MKRHARATLALPLMILLSGVVIPLAVRGGGRAPAALPADAGESRYAGRTAGEWHTMAMRSLDKGEYNLAIRYLRTAEKAEPGAQFRQELARARRERRRATEVAACRARLLGGEPENLEIDSAGAVVAAWRTTVVLPGESLWSLARELVAAELGLAASELAPDDRAVYAAWDRLTGLNGVRELDVGEIVLVPLPSWEAAAISAANAQELETIAIATRALADGDVDEAVSLRKGIEGRSATSAEALAALDGRLKLARADCLIESARGILATAEEMPRPRGHGELVGALREARRLLCEAGATSDTPTGLLMERATAMLSEAERYSVGSDGIIVATKPAGVSYTDFARETVEWFLRRELRRSGAEYPHHAQKTADEIAWAVYLLEASKLADRDGVDFVGLLTSADAEESVRLPNPADYFAGLDE